jgi:hypothetical protein
MLLGARLLVQMIKTQKLFLIVSELWRIKIDVAIACIDMDCKSCNHMLETRRLLVAVATIE